MPWKIIETADCPGGWAVVNTKTGHRAGCHSSKASARQQQKALYANQVASGDVQEQIEGDGLTAAAAGLTPLHPPGSWFENPQLKGPTPLQITADGRVFGHLATWDSCHIGEPGGHGVCVTPPRTRTDYAYFHLGETILSDGSPIPTGKITLDTGHAGLSLTRAAAAAHYDHTGSAVADVRAGEDRYGIWVAGALRPELPARRVRELRAAQLSGDWRRVNGNLEMVAALAVNVPGFPILRPSVAVVASANGEEDLALVAAGVVTHASMPEHEFAARLDALSELALDPRPFVPSGVTAATFGPRSAFAFDEAKHRREAKGTPIGGRFARSYQVDPTGRPDLAEPVIPTAPPTREELLARHAQALALMAELGPPAMWDPWGAGYYNAAWEVKETARDIAILDRAAEMQAA